MPVIEDGFCGNDMVVRAGERTSYQRASWWQPSEGMCHWAICGSGDVEAWFKAANKFIENEFKPHFERYRSHISMAQGAPTIEQAQIIKETQALLSEWDSYAYHFKRGGGGPVGYEWGDPSDPELPLLMEGDTALELSKEIVKIFDKAACLRDKFTLSRPEGMLPEAPGYGGVVTRPPAEGEGGPQMGALGWVAVGLGGWVLLKTLTE